MTFRQAYIVGVRADRVFPFTATSVNHGRGLSWVVAPSRLCDLEWTMDLQSEFTLVKVNIPWSNPEFIDDINTNDLSGFYRLKTRME